MLCANARVACSSPSTSMRNSSPELTSSGADGSPTCLTGSSSTTSFSVIAITSVWPQCAPLGRGRASCATPGG
jgi:hypothetical protein